MLRGDVVLCRGVEFVRSTSRNRLAFVQRVAEAYARISESTELSPSEFHQLLLLLCADLPLQAVYRAVEYLGRDTKDKLPFGLLLRAFRVSFVFTEFLERARQIFRTCDINDTGEVARSVYVVALRKAAQKEPRRAECAAFPLECVEQVAGQHSQVLATNMTFADFCRALFAHSAVQQLFAAGAPAELRTVEDMMLQLNIPIDVMPQPAPKRKTKRRK